ncbi:hypothetical protein [Streptomyces sp. 46]|uniref:hypothetical protein n=1 Tax=Streptomyces sp. 46 TaxID=1777322 RepID=UPI000CF28FCE|nr:hypothetical protein [Streptomyces sp. 46]PPS73341.1 hypothetical protein BV882_15710 [Streptomyces sp. 46]
MDEARRRSARRAELAGGVITSLLAFSAFAGLATKAGLPWWAVLAVAVSTVGLAGWTRRPDRPAARAGGRIGERAGEQVGEWAGERIGERAGERVGARVPMR